MYLVPPSDDHHVDVESHQECNHCREIVEIKLELVHFTSFLEKWRGPVRTIRIFDQGPIYEVTSCPLVSRRQSQVESQVDEGVHSVEDLKKSQRFPFVEVFSIMCFFCIQRHLVQTSTHFSDECRTENSSPTSAVNAQTVGNVILAIKEQKYVFVSSPDSIEYNTICLPDIVKIAFGHKVLFLGNKYSRLGYDFDIHGKGVNEY